MGKFGISASKDAVNKVYDCPFFFPPRTLLRKSTTTFLLIRDYRRPDQHSRSNHGIELIHRIFLRW